MNVLFICEGNMMRSQMAEGFYNALSGTQDAMSAGVKAYGADRVSRRAATVMDEVGVSLAGQYSKQLTEEMTRSADRIILFSVSTEPDYLLKNTKVERWDLTDLGFGEENTTELDRQVRDDIKSRAEKRIQEAV